MTEIIILFICLFCAYLAVGYTGVLLLEAEDDTFLAIIFTLFWPVVWTLIISFCVIFSFIFTFISRSGIDKNISKR